jgi:hypothetical protein
MSRLPAPSDTARIVMQTGTLSGLEVLDFGRIEPGARVQLQDGSAATVVDVEGKRLTPHGTTAGSVRIERDDHEIVWVPSGEITAVLRPAHSAASRNGNPPAQ